MKIRVSINIKHADVLHALRLQGWNVPNLTTKYKADEPILIIVEHQELNLSWEEERPDKVPMNKTPDTVPTFPPSCRNADDDSQF